jgi:NAD(P)-dependent dehydrogenase (short-subunit alcohol dehydrogenase family)
MFAQVINEGMQKGLFRECNPRLAANLIKTIVDGWVLKRWDLRGYATRQEAEKLILEMVLVGLLPGRVQSQRNPSNLTNSLSGKKALVIGAQTVLGSAICSALSAQGARVCGYINDLSPMGKHNGHLNAFIGEEIPVYSESRHGPMNAALFDRIESAFGPIDVYAHDLGIGSLEAPLPDAWETDPVLARSMDANLSCAQELAHCLTKRMPNKPWGRVIYLAPWAWDQYIDKIRFDTVSAGTMALTRSLAETLAPSHISVNCVVPGFIKTLRP